MKSRFKPLGIYFPIFIGVLLFTVTARTASLLVNFNFDTHYFDDKILITVSDYFIIASSLFFFTYIFTANKDVKLIPSFTSPETYVPTGIVSVALLFMVKSLFDRSSELMDYIRYLKELNSTSSVSLIPTQRILMILLTLAAVFAALSIVHFILTALVESHSSTKRASFGLCTVIFLSLYASYLYYSTKLPINAPNKIVDELALLFSAIFFLFETRLSIGRERWRSYVAFGFIAALMSAYSSIPSLIVYFAKGEIISNRIYENSLIFTLFIFITARLILTTKLIEDKPSRVVSALIKFAEARDAELNPIPQTPEVTDIDSEQLTDEIEAALPIENDENQMTIDDVEIQNEQEDISTPLEENTDTETSEKQPSEND